VTANVVAAIVSAAVALLGLLAAAILISTRPRS